MKKWTVLLWATLCLLTLSACGGQKDLPEILEKQNGLQTEEQADTVVVKLPQDPSVDGETGEVFVSAEKNGFELKLYTDKDTYTTDEEISIRATMEYKGAGETVTIWHGEPYITFSITDGKDFQTGGVVLTLLASTELKKGTLYEYAYRKSGGYSENDPDADFWREFYKEEALKLPAGTYTVSVNGDFHLSNQLRPEESGPSCQLQITVTE